MIKNGPSKFKNTSADTLEKLCLHEKKAQDDDNLF